MSKERLEEIKENMEEFKTTKSVRGVEDVAAEMLLNHGTWLVEQAERVQELENQNERYREALEFYADKKNHCNTPDSFSDTGYIDSVVQKDAGRRARLELRDEE